MLKLPSYRNSQLICIANQLTVFYMMATLAFNEVIHRVIAKQLVKGKHTHPVCLQAVKKYEKVNTHNDYETASKKWTDEKKTNLLWVLQKCLNSKMISSRLFKGISRK